MKRLIALAMVMVLMLSACSMATDVNKTPDSQEVTVSLGYSLDQFGLKVAEQNGIYAETCSYTDEINVNGYYTEIYGRTSAQPVPVAAVQGFYKKDLLGGSVFINGHTFTKEEMDAHLLYEDEKIAVYDISYFVYPNGIEERAGNAVNAGQIIGFASALGEAIQQKKPGNAVPNPVERVHTAPVDAVIVL